jgi:hypothetical protein
MSLTNFEIVKRGVNLGDHLKPPSGPNEINGKRVTSRGKDGFFGAAGETTWFLFLTDDSGIPPGH